MIDRVGNTEHPLAVTSIIGDSPEMAALKELLARVAASRASTVL